LAQPRANDFPGIDRHEDLSFLQPAQPHTPRIGTP
jgi:hypothetical protein